MSYTVNLQQRIQQLKKIKADLPNILAEVAGDATKRAIEATTNATPPKEGSIRGANTITGELKAHWSTDSTSVPQRNGTSYVTELANNLSYASYVNDGHRMDRHFVPGLVIDESGMLSFNPDKKGGIIVGTQTRYVKGEFMVDKGKQAYQDTVLKELDKRIQEAFK